jgi:hypothetical protein
MLTNDDSSNDRTWCVVVALSVYVSASSILLGSFTNSGLVSVLSSSCFKNGFAWKSSVLENGLAENIMGACVSSLVSSWLFNAPIPLPKVTPNYSSGVFSGSGFGPVFVSLTDSYC